MMIRFASALTIVMACAISLGAQQPPALKPIPAPDDVSKPPADAVATASGLAMKVLQPGKGTTKPALTDLVTVHYTGWTTDGKMFDSSVEKGPPISFGLNEVIEGWSEGVQLMVTGEKTRFWIPEDIAYQGKEPKGLLVFDVELINILQPK
jgi:peptidylprolyl isomerase